MVDKEMLSAISEMMDQKLEEKLEEKLENKFDEKLKPIYDKLDGLEAEMKHVVREELDNSVIPRLDRLETDMKYVKEEQLENNVIPRLDRLETDMKIVRVDQLENYIIPRLNTIEGYYIDTSRRYMESADKIDEMSMDINVLKATARSHSQKLNKISV